MKFAFILHEHLEDTRSFIIIPWWNIGFYIQNFHYFIVLSKIFCILSFFFSFLSKMQTKHTQFSDERWYNCDAMDHHQKMIREYFMHINCVCIIIKLGDMNNDMAFIWMKNDERKYEIKWRQCWILFLLFWQMYEIYYLY